MPVARETVYYDVHDFKVYPLLSDVSGASAATYGPGVDVPGIASVGLDPNLITAELKGDGRVMARKGKVDKFNLSATYGKLSLPVLEVLLGGEVTDNAEISTSWELSDDNTTRAFKASFLINDVDLGLGSIHVTLYRASLTGGALFSSATDEFGQPEMQIEAIPTTAGPGGKGRMIRVEIFAAQTPLPA